MKSIVITLIKFLLLGGLLVLLFFLIKPIRYEIPELVPLEKKDDSAISDSNVLIPETKKESEIMVAMLFGWIAPRATPTPRPRYTGPVLPGATPTPAIEGFLKVRRGTIEDEGKIYYWVKNLSTNDGFWLTEGVTSADGYRFIRLIPEGILVWHKNQYKIIRNE